MTLRLLAALVLTASVASAADWPHWLGPDRTGKAGDFAVPATWPKELKKGWSTKVGDGVATPALVGDKLFVFTREGGDEVIRCLNAATGEQVWADKYPAKAVSGPASGFGGPRASPAVADGMVITLGVQGTLSCVEAAKGTKV